MRLYSQNKYIFSSKYYQHTLTVCTAMLLASQEYFKYYLNIGIISHVKLH